ncbi:MAG: hypothetical protein ACP5D9_10605 [Mariniphaga sp.]
MEKEYFDLIQSGKKDWEYRDYKDFFIKRLMNPDGTFKSYDYILFQNGYQKNAPQMLVEFKSVKIVKEKQGLFKTKKGFEIALGKVIEN